MIYTAGFCFTYFRFQGRRGFYKRRRETTAKARVPAKSVAAVRVSGKLSSGPGGGHHICVRHTAVHRYILPGNVARVQTLQGVQHDDQWYEDRRGRGARYHRPILLDRNHLYRVVHVRAVRPLSRLPQQVALLQRRDEYD